MKFVPRIPTFVFTTYLIGIFLYGVSVKADQECNSVDACQILKDSIHAQIETLKAQLSRVDIRIQEMQQDETRTTESGIVFTRVRTQPELGEAWRDPSGVVWGDIVLRNSRNGSLCIGDLPTIPECYMDQQAGIRYCASIGAELPTRDDFRRLAEYFLVALHATPMPRASTDNLEEILTYMNSSPGYRPQVLPHLSGHGFLSSSSRRFYNGESFYGEFEFVFLGGRGMLDMSRRVGGPGAVRCVRR